MSYNNNRSKWTKRQDQILEDFYPIFGAAEVAKRLKRTTAAVMARASLKNLKYARLSEDSDIQKEELIKERQNIVDECIYLIDLIYKHDKKTRIQALRMMYDCYKYQDLLWWWSRRHLKLGQFLEIFVPGYEWSKQSFTICKKTNELRQAVLDGSLETSNLDSMIYAVNDL